FLPGLTAFISSTTSSNNLKDNQLIRPTFPLTIFFCFSQPSFLVFLDNVFDIKWKFKLSLFLDSLFMLHWLGVLILLFLKSLAFVICLLFKH
ncbi:hypothetical protein PSHT_14497, partial [Puccinia striiformis]